LLLARKRLDISQLERAHEISGYLLSVVGTLYAVLLGLVVVDAMQKFQQARDVVEREANSLADVYVFAGRLPAQKRDAVQSVCRKYAHEVISGEWPAMDKGSYSPEARRTAVKLMEAVSDFEPTTENEKALYPMIVQNASEVWDNRRIRINMATNGVPLVEWITLIIGAEIVVIFTYFFDLKHLKLQIMMTAMVAALIALNLYLLLLFGYPFSGELSIHADAFNIDESIFENRVSTAKNASVQ
ncbi:MAG TPA: hypothetical protein V6C72_16900, partial [Chroococcales cyanobacterium]